MNKKIRFLQLISHVIFLHTLIIFPFDFSFLFIGLFFYSLVLGLGISLGYHRLFSHNSFRTYKVVEIILLFLGSVATLGSSIGWVGVHRHHHQYSDEREDIHSPHIGRLKAWMGYWPKVVIKPTMIKYLLRSKLHKFFHRRYFKILFFWMITLFVLFGYQGLGYFYCFPVILCFHVTSAINVIGHSSFLRDKKTGDFSKDCLWLALLSFGEGYHHNHHKSPSSPSFGRFDLGHLFIRLISI